MRVHWFPSESPALHVVAITPAALDTIGHISAYGPRMPSSKIHEIPPGQSFDKPILKTAARPLLKKPVVFLRWRCVGDEHQTLVLLVQHPCGRDPSASS